MISWLRDKFRFNIQSQLTLFAITLVFVTSFFSSYKVITTFSSTIVKNQLQNEQRLHDQLIQNSEQNLQKIVSQLAANITNPLYYFDMTRMQDLITVARADNSILEAYVFDEKRTIVHDGSVTIVKSGKLLDHAIITQALKQPGTPQTSIMGDRIFAAQTINFGEQIIGGVYLLWCVESVNQKIELINHQGKLSMEQSSAEAREYSLVILSIALTLACVLAFLFARYSVKPIYAMLAAMRAIANGQYNTRVSFSRSDEFSKLASGLNSMVSKLESYVNKTEFLAHHDALTNLPNRRLLKTTIEALLKSRQKDKKPFALIYLDLDGFKAVNDNHSHEMGDRLLEQVGERMRRVTKNAGLLAGNYDQPSDAMIARIGGDEFCVLLTHMDDINLPGKLSGELISAISTPYSIFFEKIIIGASAGICLYPDDAINYNELLNYGDQAMYHAKQNGKGQYHYFSDLTGKFQQDQVEYENDLPHAIDKNQFKLVFQPEYDLQSEKITGAEVLLRWHLPGKGVILPNTFLPIAEKLNLLNDINKWLVKEINQLVFSTSSSNIRDFTLSFNFPANHLKDDILIRFISDIAALPDEQVFPSKIRLEIYSEEAEQICMEQELLKIISCSNRLQLWLNDCVDLMHINALGRLPLSGIKICRSLINTIDEHRVNRALVKSFVSISQDLDWEVSATGIETESQHKTLLEIDCHQGQGNLLSEPVDKATFLQQVLTQVSDQTEAES